MRTTTDLFRQPALARWIAAGTPDRARVRGTSADDLDRPALQILEIGLRPVGQIALVLGCAPKSKYLRKPAEPRLEATTLPAAQVHLPEKLEPACEIDRMRTRIDEAHVPFSDVIDRGSSSMLQQTAHAGFDFGAFA